MNYKTQTNYRNNRFRNEFTELRVPKWKCPCCRDGRLSLDRKRLTFEETPESLDTRNDEFWRIDPGIGQELSSVSFGAEELLLVGSEDQKKQYLEPIFTGHSIMGFAITEPDAGSDTASKSHPKHNTRGGSPDGHGESLLQEAFDEWGGDWEQLTEDQQKALTKVMENDERSKIGVLK